MKTTTLFLFLSIILINAYGQTAQERFGVHTGSLDFLQAKPYVDQLGLQIFVRLGGSINQGVNMNDEYGWFQVKGPGGPTDCNLYHDTNRCPYSICNCSPNSFYYRTPPARTPLPNIPEANPFMGIKINRYDSAIPTTQDSLIGDYPNGHEADYLSYVDFLLQKYKNQSKYWVVGNENDDPHFWVGTQKEYADLVALSSGKIRNTCSDCKVGVSFALPVVAHKWYTELNAVLDTFDFVDAHNAIITGFTKISGSLDSLRKYCPGKEYISTETGLPDSMVTTVQTEGGTPIKQARDLPKFNTLMFDEGYSKIYWYLIDVDYNGTLIFLHNALVNEDGVRKPAFYSYQTMISKVDSFDTITKLDTGQYKYTFANKGPVYVLWCDGAPGSCTLPPAISGSVKVTDYMGNVSTEQASSIVLDSFPIYVEPGVTSVAENTISHNLSIYPNPANSTITFSFPLNGNIEIEISNLLGKVIIKKDNQNKSDSYRIDISNLTNGMYIISVRQGQNNYIQKFIKQ